jgi:N utilization substance protein B
VASKRRARESALQVLFGLEWSGADPDDALADFWARFAGERPANFGEVNTACAALVHGVVRHKDEIDAKLQAASHHWKLDRMSAVDRNILRVGAFELLHLADEVPRKVAINEAIEVAKKFGNEDSGAFVNGILDRVAWPGPRSARRDRAAVPAVSRTASSTAAASPEQHTEASQREDA